MSPLRESLSDYLAVRRALGYKLVRDEKLLAQLLGFLAERGEQRLTTTAALAWATLPAGGAAWWSFRLSVVRGFAAHLHAIDPASEVPAADILPWPPHRATPYLYRNDQIAALIEAAATLCTPHRVATYRTLIGLLAVTGMRIGACFGPSRPPRSSPSRPPKSRGRDQEDPGSRPPRSSHRDQEDPGSRPPRSSHRDHLSPGVATT